MNPTIKDQLKDHGSDLERTFDQAWLMAGNPPLLWEKEYRFHPTRDWRFDRALHFVKVAVEMEGGAWSEMSRHRSKVGFRNDCEKYNEAAFLGWVVIRLTVDMLADKPIYWTNRIMELIGERARRML